MSFSEEKARQKFLQLNNTQQSIQTTSQWCLFHYRYSDDIVQIWLNMFLSPDQSIDQSEQNYKLALFYLCNDLVQFAKKKESKFKSYLNDFQKIIPQIMENISNDSANAHLKEKYSRVLNVWNERSIYPTDYITELKKILNNGISSIIVKQQSQQQIQNQQQQNFQSSSSTGNQSLNHLSSTSSSSSSVPIISSIPKDIAPVVSKYQNLDKLYSLYKTNFVNFNKLAANALNENNESNGNKENKKNSNNNNNNFNNNQESEIQLNSLLSSLSALQGNNVKSSNNDYNGNEEEEEEDINKRNEIELKKLDQTEEAGLHVESLSKEITQLRSELASDLRRLAGEIDDWIMLDKGKQVQIKNTINDVKSKKEELKMERENVAVYNYGSTGDDEENIPTYADNDVSDSDSDNDAKGNSDEDDDDDDDDDDKDASLSKKRSSAYFDTDGDDSDDVNENNLKKKIKKSVSFANDTETLVFDKEETIRPSESPSPEEEVVDDPSQAGAGDESGSNQDLEALLGMLK